MWPPAGHTAHVRFVGEVDEASVAALLDAADRAIDGGADRLEVWLSTPGGSVLQGLTAFNYLTSLPAEVHTHNLGCVDSVGAVLYCAGRLRTTAPDARFLLHGLVWGFGDERLGEAELSERLAKLRVDTRNVAAVVAQGTGQSEAVVLAAMRARTVLDAPAAVAFGLAHEVARVRRARGEVRAIGHGPSA